MTSSCRSSQERLVVSSKVKRAGPFLLGPNLGHPPPVKCMQQYLGRKEQTHDFYTLKILTIRGDGNREPESIEEQQGKILLHTEHTLLKRLKGKPGIIGHRGFFKEVVDEEIDVGNGKILQTGSRVTRLCLVLDSIATPHDFNDTPSKSLHVNLQYYLLKNKKLPELEAVTILLNIVQIVERLHKENIVHRDLKLGNFTLNIETKEVILSSFCLGKELESPDQLLKDQRGSPAYISPEVISGKLYLGKPSDMWALGVGFYTMLFGRYPFYDVDPQELFRQIKAAEYKIPGDTIVGTISVSIIKALLVLNPNKRLTASDLLHKLRSYLSLRYSFPSPLEDLQVVPELPCKRPHPVASENSSLGDPQRSGSSETCEKPAKLQNVFDLEEVLMASASQLEKDEENEVDEESKEGQVGRMQEPPAKLPKYVLEPTTCLRSIKVLKVKEDARVLSCGDLEKLYAIYVANKRKGDDVGGTVRGSAPSVLPSVGHSVTEGGGDGFTTNEEQRNEDARISSTSERRIRVAVRRVQRRDSNRLGQVN